MGLRCGSVGPGTVGARTHQAPTALIKKKEVDIILHEAEAIRVWPTVFRNGWREVAGVVVTVSAREGEGNGEEGKEEGELAEKFHYALLLR